MVVLPNPAQPLVHVEADFTAGPPALVGSSGKSLNAAALRRTVVRQVSIARGRQYELDQVQAGTCDLDVLDPLEYLNPLNAGSPFMTGGNTIKPYRAERVDALWPVAPGSGNIINTGVSTTYDPSFETTVGGWVRAGGTTTAVLSTAQFFAGAKSLLITQSATGAGTGMRNGFRTAPGISYCFSAYVRPTGGAVQLQVTAADGSVALSAVASTLNVWTRLSVSWTSVDTAETVLVFSTSTSAYYLDATQLEFGATPTAFTITGPTMYPLFNGYVERYPQKYDMAGTRSQHALTAVDALAILSRTVISQSYKATILADAPSAYIPCDDSASPQVVRRPSGGVPMLGYFNQGTNGQVNYAGDSFLDGTAALVVAQQNASPPVGGNPAYITYVGTRGGAVSMNPQAFTLEVWVRALSGTSYLGAASMGAGEDANTAATGPNYQVGWYTASGALSIHFTDPNSGGSGVYSVGNGADFRGYPDGKWHHLVLSFPGGSTFRSIVDGVFGGAPGVGFTPSTGIALDNFYIDATTYYGDALSSISVAHMAAYTSVLSNTQITTHYRRGIGYANELSGARVTRLLTQYWAGPTSVAAGSAKLAPDWGYDGRTMLDVLLEIQGTERGLLYAAKSGALVFEDRSTRYANQVALWTLGENPPGASPVEYPYSDYAGDFDPTYVFSQVNLSRPGNSQVTPQINTQAQADYGQRILSQTVQVNSDFEVQQAGIYYLARYSLPKVRVENIVLNPSGTASLWPLVLGLELSQRLTIKRRTGSLTTSNDYYVEGVSHTIDNETGDWSVSLRVSPVFVPQAWVLGDSTYGVLGTARVIY